MIVEGDGQETEVILCQDHVLGHQQGLVLRNIIGDVIVIAILPWVWVVVVQEVAEDIDIDGIVGIVGVVVVVVLDLGIEVIVIRGIIGGERLDPFLLGQELDQELTQGLAREVFLDHFLGHIQELARILGLGQGLEQR